MDIPELPPVCVRKDLRRDLSFPGAERIRSNLGASWIRLGYGAGGGGGRGRRGACSSIAKDAFFGDPDGETSDASATSSSILIKPYQTCRNPDKLNKLTTGDVLPTYSNPFRKTDSFKPKPQTPNSYRKGRLLETSTPNSTPYSKADSRPRALNPKSEPKNRRHKSSQLEDKRLHQIHEAAAPQPFFLLRVFRV